MSLKIVRKKHAADMAIKTQGRVISANIVAMRKGN
jgi:hypothetical protein